MAGPRASTAVTDRPRDVAPAAEPARADTRSRARHGAAVAPGGLVVVGLATLLVGAWGGIVPFAGPALGFSATGTGAWHWSLSHALLWLAPGAVAVACGLVMLGLVPRALAGTGRVGAAATGLVVAACGAWFVVGPAAWPVLQHTGRVFVPASPMRELAYVVGYSLGPGVLLCMFGAFAMGWSVCSRRARFPVAAAAEAPA